MIEQQQNLLDLMVPGEVKQTVNPSNNDSNYNQQL